MSVLLFACSPDYKKIGSYPLQSGLDKSGFCKYYLVLDVGIRPKIGIVKRKSYILYVGFWKAIAVAFLMSVLLFASIFFPFTLTAVKANCGWQKRIFVSIRFRSVIFLLLLSESFSAPGIYL